MKITTTKPGRPTYSIEDLTEEQAKALCALIGAAPSNCFNGILYTVFSKLDDVLTDNRAYAQGWTRTDIAELAFKAIP